MEEETEQPEGQKQNPSTMMNKIKSQGDPYTQLLLNWDHYYDDLSEFGFYKNDKLKHPLIPDFGTEQLQWDLTENTIDDLMLITFPSPSYSQILSEEY